MDIDKEKELLYQLMRSVIEERRELSKQYMDLKNRLDSLDRSDPIINSKKDGEKGKASKHPFAEKRSEYPPRRKSKKEPIERIAGYVSEILRKAAIPISSIEIYEQLISNYDLHIQYINFRNNILPRIEDLKQYSIEKAYRGYWQYRRENT